MKRSFFALLLVMLTVFGGRLGASERSCGPMEIYEFALPKLLPDNEVAGAAEVVVLRYIPGDTSTEHEYRIVLLTDAAGHIRAFRTQGDQSSIQSQMRRLKASGRVSCQEIVHELKLSSRDFRDARTLRSLLDGLKKLRVRLDLPSEYYLDADRYEISITSGMNEVSWTLYGQQNSPLIRWFERTSTVLPIREVASTHCRR